MPSTGGRGCRWRGRLVRHLPVRSYHFGEGHGARGCARRFIHMHVTRTTTRRSARREADLPRGAQLGEANLLEDSALNSLTVINFNPFVGTGWSASRPPRARRRRRIAAPIGSRCWARATSASSPRARRRAASRRRVEGFSFLEETAERSPVQAEGYTVYAYDAIGGFGTKSGLDADHDDFGTHLSPEFRQRKEFVASIRRFADVQPRRRLRVEPRRGRARRLRHGARARRARRSTGTSARTPTSTSTRTRRAPARSGPRSPQTRRRSTWRICRRMARGRRGRRATTA